MIRTERNCLATLIILQKIFARGMVEDQVDVKVINKLFHNIEQFVEFMKSFVKLLIERQQESQVTDLYSYNVSG